MLAPNYGVESTPHSIYDMYDVVVMIVPEYDNEGVDLVEKNRSDILYEEESPRESHHCRYHLVSRLTTHSMLMK